MDNVDKETRSKTMSRVMAKGNMSTELLFRMGLVRRGIKGWKVNHMSIPGKPDFWFENERVAVFVDGCFWHGCPKCYRRPNSNQEYWDAKVKRVKRRDRAVKKELTALGFGVLRVWEHEIKDSLTNALDRLQSMLNKRAQA
jgi:DNA mismatch endonuclease (patch repair protein)